MFDLALAHDPFSFVRIGEPCSRRFPGETSSPQTRLVHPSTPRPQQSVPRSRYTLDTCVPPSRTDPYATRPVITTEGSRRLRASHSGPVLRGVTLLQKSRCLIGAGSPTCRHSHIEKPQVHAELPTVLIPVIEHDVP